MALGSTQVRPKPSLQRPFRTDVRKPNPEQRRISPEPSWGQPNTAEGPALSGAGETCAAATPGSPPCHGCADRGGVPRCCPSASRAGAGAGGCLCSCGSSTEKRTRCVVRGDTAMVEATTHLRKPVFRAHRSKKRRWGRIKTAREMEGVPPPSLSLLQGAPGSAATPQRLLALARPMLLARILVDHSVRAPPHFSRRLWVLRELMLRSSALPAKPRHSSCAGVTSMRYTEITKRRGKQRHTCVHHNAGRAESSRR